MIRAVHLSRSFHPSIFRDVLTFLKFSIPRATATSAHRRRISSHRNGTTMNASRPVVDLLEPLLMTFVCWYSTSAAVATVRAIFWQGVPPLADLTTKTTFPHEIFILRPSMSIAMATIAASNVAILGSNFDTFSASSQLDLVDHHPITSTSTPSIDRNQRQPLPFGHGSFLVTGIARPIGTIYGR